MVNALIVQRINEISVPKEIMITIEEIDGLILGAELSLKDQQSQTGIYADEISASFIEGRLTAFKHVKKLFEKEGATPEWLEVLNDLCNNIEELDSNMKNTDAFDHAKALICKTEVSLTRRLNE